ncbi:MAG: DNA polymerase III subunit delta' C-terminal domain-containing protein, partial [Vulcanimicrobiota bacterium]
AQNALLKTLEEPGERIIIVLVTSRPSDLLPTVVSRCRQLKFIPLPLEKVKQILIKSGAETGREISMLVNYSWGAPGKAVELAQNKTFWDLRDKLLENLNALPDGNLEDILEFVKKFHVSRSQVFELESVFEILLSWCRDIQFLQEGMKGEELINSDRFNELNQIIYCFSAEDIVNIQELIYELRNLVFNNNMNLNLALQRLFIKIKNYGSVKI